MKKFHKIQLFLVISLINIFLSQMLFAAKQNWRSTIFSNKKNNSIETKLNPNHAPYNPTGSGESVIIAGNTGIFAIYYTHQCNSSIGSSTTPVIINSDELAKLGITITQLTPVNFDNTSKKCSFDIHLKTSKTTVKGKYAINFTINSSDKIRFYFDIVEENLNYPFCAPSNCPVRDNDNGIKVGQTKLYDEASFRAMVQNLSDELTSLKLINQTSLVNNYGRVQGATLSTSSFGLNVSTVPIPGVTTTTNTGDTATSNTTTTQSATPSTVINLNTVTPNTVQTAVTNPSVTPQIPTLPGQTSAYSLAQQPGVSSQDLLSEQISLEYQLMDWRLLLERSLTDRVYRHNSFVNGSTKNEDYYGERDSAIVGFQVNIDPTRTYKDAVAEMEIVIDTQSPEVNSSIKTSTNTNNSEQKPLQQQRTVNGVGSTGSNNTDTPDNNEVQNDEDLNAPSLVMMLPRDKSYNTAVATKNSKSIGLGAVLEVISVAGNYGKTNESLYIVGDTDTVAFERNGPHSEVPIKPANTAVTFGWQFRPVLGQRVVKSGQRQVYALLALPEHHGALNYAGIVKVYTRWRKYDSKNKIVGDVIPGSESYSNLDNLNVYSAEAERVLSPRIDDISWEDLGNGQLLVKGTGQNFIEGLSIQAGNKIISTPADGLSVQNDSSFILLLPTATLGSVDITI